MRPAPAESALPHPVAYADATADHKPATAEHDAAGYYAAAADHKPATPEHEPAAAEHKPATPEHDAAGDDDADSHSDAYSDA